MDMNVVRRCPRDQCPATALARRGRRACNGFITKSAVHFVEARVLVVDRPPISGAVTCSAGPTI